MEVAEKQLPKMKRDFNETKNVIRNIDNTQLRNINEAGNSYESELKILLKSPSSQAKVFTRNLDANFVDALMNNNTDKLKKLLGDDLYKVFTDTDLVNRIPLSFLPLTMVFVKQVMNVP